MLFDHRGQALDLRTPDGLAPLESERIRPSLLSPSEKYGAGLEFERYAFDNEDDAVIVQRIQNCTPFLERNHYIREHTEDWRGDDNTMWKVASVPNIILEKWLKMGIRYWADEDWPKIRKLLNGEYKFLKTTPKEI